jgi:hypothetical protein
MNPHILPHDPPCLTPTTFQAIVDTLPGCVGLVGKTVVAAARSGSIYGRSPRGMGFFGIWPTLGCSYLFGLWRNFVADLDEIRGLAPNYLGGLWSPIEPAGLASSGPTGLPSCVRLPSHSRNLLAPSYQAALR